MNTKAYFVSDLHLTSGDDERTQKFVAFLRDIRSDATHLFLVGDIFDLWVADHDYFVDRFASVVASIRKLVRAGIEVHYFEGNHDLHLTKFWQEDVGAKVHANGADFELANVCVRVEHGDLINPDDKGYLFLRKFLRTRGMKTIAHGLPSKLVSAIGERASRASRDYTSNAKSLPDEHMRVMIRAHAERVARERRFDLMITGHVHVKDDAQVSVGDRKIRSVNLGSWFGEPAAFVLDESGGRFMTL